MSEIFHIPVKYASSVEGVSSYKPELEQKPIEHAELEPLQSEVAELPHVPELPSAEQKMQNMVALKAAEVDVREALETKSLTEVIDGIDFSDKKFSFVARDSYHAEATVGSGARFEGNGSPRQGGHILPPQYFDEGNYTNEKWGDPLKEAHYSNQPVEKVGIRANDTWARVQAEKVLPIPGIRGKLGFKRNQIVTETVKQAEPAYTFDYEFAAPSNSEDQAALDIGNRTGQGIRLSLNLSKEQAIELSKAIENDPTVARSVVDAFVAKTGDNGKWNAEIFKENGEFEDPGERYGDDLRARDVRPRYQAMPEFKPEIVGLITEARLESEDAEVEELEEAA